MTRGGILIVPAREKGGGGGHLCRCISLACDLRAKGRAAWLYLPAEAQTGNLLQSMNFNPEWRITDENIERVRAETELVILDRFQTEANELSRWKKIAPVIGIDEGGKSRDGFDFLIDILTPEKMGIPKANICSVSLLKFPPKKAPQKCTSQDRLKVLITFGQEDSSGLGQKTALRLSDEKDMDITLLKGELANADTQTPPNVRVIKTIPNLAEHLCEYDLVITHYGITAYEALYSGTMVLLASPSRYHAKLAKAVGFLSIDSKFYRALSGANLNNLKKHCERLAAKHGLDKEGASLADLCFGLSAQVNRICPLCGAKTPRRCVSRFSERTYRRCSKCGVIYMDRSCPPPVEYEKEYFFEFYKKQYGKTYLEDFQNIKAQGKRRLKIINSILQKKVAVNRSLLDIGCAYGPFLAAAREEGFSPAGIDPAQDAVRYVQEELGIPAVRGFFPDSPLPSFQSYDAVSLWFVIEHFRDCATVLAAIKKILKAKGVLAFSTPSFSGISGRSCLRRFLSASPADHYTVWSPVMCKKALAQAGFRVKKITSIGHHPERFPFLGKLAKSKKSPLYGLLLAISKLFKLGDSFEVYAQLI